MKHESRMEAANKKKTNRLNSHSLQHNLALFHLVHILSHIKMLRHKIAHFHFRVVGIPVFGECERSRSKRVGFCSHNCHTAA